MHCVLYHRREVALLLFLLKSVSLQTFPHNNHFYPYGPDVGDSTLPGRDDDSSPEISMATELVFFDTAYDSIWVSFN